jgi:nucleolar protein 9
MFVSQLLTEACNSVCEHLFDFLTNRYATHVARRLLCIIAGRNVLPLAAKSQNKVCLQSLPVLLC